MADSQLSFNDVKKILAAAARKRILVVGDVMLDQFIWGNVSRISPEAPVPVVEFIRENYMPGGAANVARNLAALGGRPEIFGIVGYDSSGPDSGARKLHELLRTEDVNCSGLIPYRFRPTTLKTRIFAHQQQVVRVDREGRGDINSATTTRLLSRISKSIDGCSGVIIGDYGKGLVTQLLVDRLKIMCRTKKIPLSLDPKPIHSLDLTDLWLITPNRKEAFDLAGISDDTRCANPLKDKGLLLVVKRLMETLFPKVLLITLGDQGMLLCQPNTAPFHIPTVAQEVFDVSGAGDTVIASFTLAIAAGASPMEAAIISNHAAGVVVGKVGTATVTPDELLASFQSK
jgi:D-beta-D-heptose 7-phosphate kinase/D-beta-D-heptose 1-phosphate adenosyltransferase